MVQTCGIMSHTTVRVPVSNSDTCQRAAQVPPAPVKSHAQYQFLKQYHNGHIRRHSRPRDIRYIVSVYFITYSPEWTGVVEQYLNRPSMHFQMRGRRETGTNFIGIFESVFISIPLALHVIIRCLFYNFAYSMTNISDYNKYCERFGEIVFME